MYRRGNDHVIRGIPCTKSVMKGENYNSKAMERSGWYLRPEDIPYELTPESMIVNEPEEEVVADDVEATPDNSVDDDNEETIRQMAKDEGIKSWHVKKIETLKKELGLNDAEQPEIGSD